MVGRGAGGVPVDLGGPAVEMLVCMGPVVERGAGGGPHLIRGGSAVEKVGLYGAGGRKGCWRGLRLI